MEITGLQSHVSAADLPPEQLANSTVLSERQKVAEASRQFEAMLLRQILASTQKTVIPSEFSDNSTAAGIYQDMITNQLADAISKSGAFGLAQTFEQQLQRQAGPEIKPGAASAPSQLASTHTHSSAPRPHTYSYETVAGKSH